MTFSGGGKGRTDAVGRAYKGSQRWIQTFVNERPEELNRAIAAAAPELAGGDVTWVSPLACDRYKEYMDTDFLRALGVSRLNGDLGGFWPKSGPRWDALAKVKLSDGREGALLVEAKSNVPELSGGGCGAGPGSRPLIEASLATARRWCGADPAADWTGPLYQYANRIAHLYFFREIVKIPAWLVNVYFANDQGHKPTARREWEAEIPRLKTALGLPGGRSAPYCVDLILDCTTGADSPSRPT